jgi:hypothetical protein
MGMTPNLSTQTRRTKKKIVRVAAPALAPNDLSLAINSTRQAAETECEAAILGVPRA